MSMSGTEMLPSAPLALVAVEIRYPSVSDDLLTMSIQKELRDAIGSDWVIQSDKTQTLEAGVGPTGPHSTIRSDIIGRIMSRQRTKVITVQADNCTIEVSDYTEFNEFRNLIGDVASAVQKVLRPDGITRMGIRYINEICEPSGNTNWTKWLSARLMPPELLPQLKASEWTGAVKYDVTANQILVFRYGLASGPVVSTNGPLRRTWSPNGPVFMLDFDSSWQPTDIPAFSPEVIVSRAAKLREPLRQLFDSVVSSELMDSFRQERSK
jgi:uncharacterized protein (TIGR04255 family)